MGHLTVLAPTMSSSHKRNVLYWCFVRSEYGMMGRRNRVRIPECVVRFILSISPSNDGQYTGHHDVMGMSVMITIMKIVMIQ